MSILPKIESDVPPELLKDKTPTEQWLYNQQSIQRQLLEQIVMQQREAAQEAKASAEDRASLNRSVAALDKRLKPFEEIKNRISNWKVVLFAIVSVFAGPLAVGLIIEWLKAHWPFKP